MNAAELARFREGRPWWDDLPDEAVGSSMEYAVWRVSEAIRDLVQMVVVPIVNWFEQRLKR